jgi:hypothetical protein
MRAQKDVFMGNVTVKGEDKRGREPKLTRGHRRVTLTLQPGVAAGFPDG